MMDTTGLNCQESDGASFEIGKLSIINKHTCFKHIHHRTKAKPSKNKLLMRNADPRAKEMPESLQLKK